MGCFVVPAGEAVVVEIAKKILSQNKYNQIKENSFVKKSKWLTNLLWGGSVLLAFEHVWHGEIVPFFPFFTAAYNPGDFARMLHEMATVGGSMAGLITCVWIGMVVVSNAIENRGVENDIVN